MTKKMLFNLKLEESMKKIDRKTLKEMWIKFYEEKGHFNVGSASLIPENDATVLFTTAGMHPLVPFLLGEKHPAGTRLCNVQKCLRTNDIDEVGDKSHLTMFEMMGNWSLGDYFKDEMIRWSYEFITSEKYLGIPIKNLAVTVFEGDEICPRDDYSANIWRECGIPCEKIFYLPKSENWWALAGGVGPCGPDSEMFYDNGQPKCSEKCSPACNCGKYMEIGNDVFMQYTVNTPGGATELLAQKNVDTGMGLERILCVMNGVNTVYDTELFANAIKLLEENSGISYEDTDDKKPFRVICDHIRSATMIIGDEIGAVPSNVGQGYVLRRLIRRAIRYARKLNVDYNVLLDVADNFVEYFQEDYPSLVVNKTKIRNELSKEISKFSQTLVYGQKEFEKQIQNIQGNVLDGFTAFRLYDTFGFPLELTIEMAEEHGLTVDVKKYEECFAEHQQISRQGAEQAFKGGLKDTSVTSARLHTATHLLLSALRKLFGNDVEQRGSNITPERLRFDFNFDRKILPEELIEIEKIVNEAISKKIDIICENMSVEDAKKQGAVGIFENKYGDVVKVYTIPGFSKEICGGPHAQNTSELHHFKILKEESSSSGIRRIKAILD